VFEGLVWSGFLAPKEATVNHNWLRPQPPFQITRLNHIGLVVMYQLVSTGLEDG